VSAGGRTPATGTVALNGFSGCAGIAVIAGATDTGNATCAISGIPAVIAAGTIIGGTARRTLGFGTRTGPSAATPAPKLITRAASSGGPALTYCEPSRTAGTAVNRTAFGISCTPCARRAGIINNNTAGPSDGVAGLMRPRNRAPSARAIALNCLPAGTTITVVTSATIARWVGRSGASCGIARAVALNSAGRTRLRLVAGIDGRRPSAAGGTITGRQSRRHASVTAGCGGTVATDIRTSCWRGGGRRAC